MNNLEALQFVGNAVAIAAIILIAIGWIWIPYKYLKIERDFRRKMRGLDRRQDDRS